MKCEWVLELELHGWECEHLRRVKSQRMREVEKQLYRTVIKYFNYRTLSHYFNESRIALSLIINGKVRDFPFCGYGFTYTCSLQPLSVNWDFWALICARIKITTSHVAASSGFFRFKNATIMSCSNFMRFFEMGWTVVWIRNHSCAKTSQNVKEYTIVEFELWRTRFLGKACWLKWLMTISIE